MTSQIDQFALFTGLVGGLALFLFGMDILTRALKQVAGASMREILSRATRNRFTGLSVGAITTAVVQSSSVTTVLLVGFISAGLMSTAQSLPVILGANIGTTITAQILAFKVTAAALPLLAGGFFVSFLATSKTLREYGRVVLGLGMLFFGMTIMSEAMKPLRSFEPFLDFMQSLDNVLLAALIGAVFTAIVQSSSATTAILIVMASEGLIGLEPAIAMALGANVGTCVTAMIATFGKTRAALRAALFHTLFNVAGVLLWIGFVGELAHLAQQAVPGGTDAALLPRQLAVAHTIFNTINALLFIGFTPRLADLLERLVPDRPELGDKRTARFMEAGFLTVPDLAMDATRREVVHMGQLVRELLDACVPAVLTGSPVELDRLRLMDRPIDLLHREIIGYLRQLSIGSLPDRIPGQMIPLIRIANDLEHLGDMVSNGLVTSARKRMEEDVLISPQTIDVIKGMHGEVSRALDGVLQALDRQDLEIAKRVRKMKPGYSRLADEAGAHHLRRLRENGPKRLQTYAREMELTEILDDLFRIIRRIARTEVTMFGGAPVG